MNPQKSLVPAEIWSANFAIKAKIDAALWFERARASELRDLATAGWHGAGEGASLVSFFASLDEEVRIVVQYARRAGTEVHFQVDDRAAGGWMLDNGPRLRVAASAGAVCNPPGSASAQPSSTLGEPLKKVSRR